MTSNKKVLMSIVPKGRKNAIGRTELAYLMGVSDTALRRLIAETVADGYLIVNAEDGAGYYVPETPEDVDIALRKHRSRRKKLEAKIDLMQRVRKQMAEGGACRG